MSDEFYTSTEAAIITGCTRRQLQHWREKGLIVPTVNASGKGRNVYYSETDLLSLTVMEYLLSLGLNFEVSRTVLELLKHGEAWMFQRSPKPEKSKHFMVLTGKQSHLLIKEFDKKQALKVIEDGFPVIPFWSDRIHERLDYKLSCFLRQPSLFEDELHL